MRCIKHINIYSQTYAVQCAQRRTDQGKSDVYPQCYDIGGTIANVLAADGWVKKDLNGPKCVCACVQVDILELQKKTVEADTWYCDIVAMSS